MSDALKKWARRNILRNAVRLLCGFGVHYVIQTKGRSDDTCDGMPWAMWFLQCMNCGRIVGKSYSPYEDFQGGVYRAKTPALTECENEPVTLWSKIVRELREARKEQP